MQEPRITFPLKSGSSVSIKNIIDSDTINFWPRGIYPVAESLAKLLFTIGNFAEFNLLGNLVCLPWPNEYNIS